MDISGVGQEVEPDLAGDAEFDPWGQVQGEESQWGSPLVDSLITNGVEMRTGQPDPSLIFNGLSSTAPPPAETDEAPTIYSSDGRMSLTVRKFLGAGAHGTVLLADWEEGRREVAVKVSHKLFISELDCKEPGLRNLKNDLEVLKALKKGKEYKALGSKFFLELFKSWQDEKNVYFVMDMYPWNLDDLRWADPNWDASIGDKILWSAEMVCFPLCLHSALILTRPRRFSVFRRSTVRESYTVTSSQQMCSSPPGDISSSGTLVSPTPGWTRSLPTSPLPP